jgi:hypothetical protein
LRNSPRLGFHCTSFEKRRVHLWLEVFCIFSAA